MEVVHTHKPSVAEVFITDELRWRAPRKTDFLQEKLAVQDLAARMADRPEEILPRFVDLAMEMTGGVSAGLSLYEEEPAPGLFRWRYLRGMLAPFEGATTPRNFSPCGITLDRNGPVLSAHPERVYDWISDADMVIPEVLLVPLYLRGTAPLGTLWIVSDREGHFDRGHARAMTELASFVGIALRMQQDERRLQRALEQQQMLAREMSHRVKNLFAVIDGMVRSSARGASSKDELVEMLSGRLQALASAQALVQRDFGEAGAPARASDVGTLVGAIVRPYEGAAGLAASRFAIEGPPIACGERATSGIALILHELATNAAKHGALSTGEGRVAVDWREEEDSLVLRWREQGGPPVEAAPSVEGFGSTLVQAMIRQLGATLDYDWRPAGLAVTITIPMARLSA